MRLSPISCLTSQADLYPGHFEPYLFRPLQRHLLPAAKGGTWVQLELSQGDQEFFNMIVSQVSQAANIEESEQGLLKEYESHQIVRDMLNPEGTLHDNYKQALVFAFTGWRSPAGVGGEAGGSSGGVDDRNLRGIKRGRGGKGKEKAGDEGGGGGGGADNPAPAAAPAATPAAAPSDDAPAAAAFAGADSAPSPFRLRDSSGGRGARPVHQPA